MDITAKITKPSLAVCEDMIKKNRTVALRSRYKYFVQFVDKSAVYWVLTTGQQVIDFRRSL